MAFFFGTSRQDTFLGLSSEDNLFSFRPGVLQAFDSIIGGTGSFLDTIAFTAPARVQAGKFDVVSNIEVVRLDVPGIELTVSRQLVETSQLGYLIVEGSSGTDFVSGQPTNVNRAPVTGSIHFYSNGGADTFIGGEGDDQVIFGPTPASGTVLDGRGGTDTIVFTENILYTLNGFTQIDGFENIELRGLATQLIVNALPFANGLSELRVESFGSNLVNATLGEGQNLLYVAGSGTDRVTLNGAGGLTVLLAPGELGFEDFLTGGTGSFDTLTFTGSQLVTAQDLAHVEGFETIRLNGAQELFIPQALFDSGLGTVVGDADNQVVRADAVTTGGHNIYFNPGEGSDQFFGGAETSIWSSLASEIDSSDFFDAGVGGGYDFLQIFGDNQSVSAEALGSFLNVDGFQVFGNNTSVTLNANQANTADGYISTLYLYGTGSTIDASAVSGDQFLIDVFAGQNNTYIGTQGADIIFLNAFNGNFVDGFDGLDQVQLNDQSSPDLTDLGAVVDNVESIYLQPSTPEILFLDPSDIPDITGGGPLIIGRDPNNPDVSTIIESDTQWSVVATGLSQFDVEQIAGYQGVWFLGNSFTQYTADGETVFIEDSIAAFTGVAPNFVVTTLDDEGYDGGTLEEELADGGGLSLREAIGLANNDSTTFDRIGFSADLSGGTITLDAFNDFTPELELSGLVAINGDIDGDGVADITVDGAGQTRIFHILGIGDGLETTVTLNGLVLTNGFASSSLDSGRGGAVLVEFGADATIRNSRISGNLADNEGGGVAVDFATLTIDNSEISSNQGLDGGGVYARDAQTVIRDSLISENSGDYGGGVYATGFGDTFNTLDIINTQIEGNTAQSDGGGLYIDSFGVDAELANVTVYRNGAGNSGGGIALQQAALDATNLTLADNNAGTGGGLAIIDSFTASHFFQATVTGNVAENVGGGIYVEASEAPEFANSIITANFIPVDPPLEDNVSGAFALLGNHIVGDTLTVDGLSTIVQLEDIFEGIATIANGARVPNLSDNGGTVWTVALLDGGVAQDAGSFTVEPADTFDLDNDGDTSETVPFDARGEGFARVIDAGIDLGAFESGIAPSDSARAPTAPFSVAALPFAPSHAALAAIVAEALGGPAPVADVHADFALAVEAATHSTIHGDLFAPQIA